MRPSPTRPQLLTLPPTFGYLVATLVGFAALGSLALTGRAPWDPWLVALDRGWVAEAWGQSVAGVWHVGFERSAFVPCSGLAGGVSTRRDEAWLADLEGSTFSELRARVWGEGRLLSDTAVFVAWFGDVSPRGAFGHLGGYARAIAVRAPLRVGPADAGACARARMDPHLFAVE
jgi:hypothetical protein